MKKIDLINEIIKITPISRLAQSIAFQELGKRGMIEGSWHDWKWNKEALEEKSKDSLKLVYNLMLAYPKDRVKSLSEENTSC